MDCANSQLERMTGREPCYFRGRSSKFQALVTVIEVICIYACLNLYTFVRITVSGTGGVHGTIGFCGIEMLMVMFYFVEENVI